MEISIGNIKAYYEIHGEGLPIVMLHGWGTDHRILKGCIEPVFSDKSASINLNLTAPEYNSFLSGKKIMDALIHGESLETGTNPKAFRRKNTRRGAVHPLPPVFQGGTFMNGTDISISRANDEEIDTLLKLWIEKSRWLEERGKKLWDVCQFSRANLTEKYDDPVYYVCRSGEEIIGGFILIEYDRRYWPDRKHEPSFYLHKFMVCNGFNGNGYARAILDRVKEYGRGMGKDFIRLDYDPARPAIEKLYAENGFTVVERTVSENGKPLAKAEYRIPNEGERQ